MEGYIWIGAAVAGWLIMEVIRFFMTREGRTLSDNEFKLLDELYTMHKKTDDDGRPLWYISPIIEKRQQAVLEQIQKIQMETLAVQATQTEVIRLLHEIVITQRETAKVLEILLNKFSK